MAGAAVAQVAQLGLLLFQHLQSSLAQGGNTQNSAGILTVLAAGGIATIGQRVLHSRVNHQHAHGGVHHGDELVGEVLAVQHEGVILATVGRDELVHDATGHVHELMFRCLADEGALRGRHFCTAKGGQRRAGGHLKSGTGRQAATTRHVGINQHIHGGHLDATTLQHADNATHIIAPEGITGLGYISRVNLNHSLAQSANPAVLAGGRRGDSNDVDVIESHRQHKAIVVIGMLTDKVYAAGGGGDNRGLVSEVLLKVRGNRFCTYFALL